jgi:serine/threonine protein kinase
MEYTEGLNLKEYLTHYYQTNAVSYLPMEKIKIIAGKILDGLSYLHQNKIIHRDLKPENVIVNEDLSEVKIVDFGICTKVIASETFKQRSLLGTPYYMAPEVILEKPYAFEADVWSLGCIIYELVCGVKPYCDMNPFNAMLKMAQYTSPLEYADESIQDIFYDKQNRQLLDFLQKCWRPNNMFRPSSTELVAHKFLQ